MRMNSQCAMVAGVVDMQRGSALVTGLVFLVAIMLLGLSASSGSIQQEMGIRSIRDQSVALEAADAALRAGETWLRTNSGPLSVDYGPRFGSVLVQADGFCDANNNDCAAADAKFWNDNGQPLGQKGASGIVDPTPVLNLVADQPRYIIELMLCPNPPCTGPPNGQTRYYRITARGVGLSAKTERIVQSIYRYN